MRRTWLSLCAAALVSCASVSAHAADPDPWFGKDKALHFGAAGALALGGYVTGVGLFDARAYGLLTGGALAAVAGIGKETYDLTGAGDPSWRDLTWDGIGAVAGLAGLAVAFTLDVVTRGVTARAPLLVTPQADAHAVSLSVLGRF